MAQTCVRAMAGNANPRIKMNTISCRAAPAILALASPNRPHNVAEHSQGKASPRLLCDHERLCTDYRPCPEFRHRQLYGLDRYLLAQKAPLTCSDICCHEGDVVGPERTPPFRATLCKSQHHVIQIGGTADAQQLQSISRCTGAPPVRLRVLSLAALRKCGSPRCPTAARPNDHGSLLLATAHAPNSAHCTLAS